MHLRKDWLGDHMVTHLRVSISELVHFDGVVVRDGVLGCSDGALYRRWKENNSSYCEFVNESMNMTRFLQINLHTGHKTVSLYLLCLNS